MKINACTRISLFIILAAAFLGACQKTSTPEATITARPSLTATIESSPTNTATLTPTATATPQVSEWVIGDVVEEWQKPVINQAVAVFWKLLYSPENALPNCQAASEMIYSVNTENKEFIAGMCDDYAEQGWYVKEASIGTLQPAYYAFPEDSYIVVRLDTAGSWNREIRYWSDNGLMSTNIMEHRIVDIAMVIEDGHWKIAAIEAQDGK